MMNKNELTIDKNEIIKRWITRLRYIKPDEYMTGTRLRDEKKHSALGLFAEIIQGPKTGLYWRHVSGGPKFLGYPVGPEIVSGGKIHKDIREVFTFGDFVFFDDEFINEVILNDDLGPKEKAEKIGERRRQAWRIQEGYL